jgi:hypothetical protein
VGLELDDAAIQPGDDGLELRFHACFRSAAPAGTRQRATRGRALCRRALNSAMQR